MQPTGILDTAKATNPLKDLLKFGQSVWLDYIRRDLITSGELKRLIEEDGLLGMTSNPAIFEKAIAGSTLYQDFLDSISNRTDLDAKGRYELLALRDIQDAADFLRPVYQSTNRRDGYVSLEVSPYLANDTKATIEEARTFVAHVESLFMPWNIPGLLAGFTDDCVIRFGDLPEFRGKAELEKLFRSRSERQIGYRLRKELRSLSGDRIANYWEGEWQDSVSGKQMAGRGVEIWVMRDGKIAIWEAAFNFNEKGKPSAMGLS